MSMKKFSIAILIISLISNALCGCGSAPEKTDAEVSIVTTIFPEYDWTANVLGKCSSDIDLKLLCANGVDMHSYQPTVSDMVAISNCDLFIYVGGESDEWATEALKSATNKNMIVLNLMEVLGSSVKEEEIREGMEAEEEKKETEYDEHIWLSLKNAKACVEAICDALIKIDAEHTDTYESNAESYISELNKLDEEYQTAVANAPRKTLLFGDRFPFRYLADDYDLSYYAAFPGCSAESEASFETITFLASKVCELELTYVLKLEGSDGRIAEAIISASEKAAQVAEMNSMQAVTAEEIESGATYLDIMNKNLETIKTVLN